VQIETLAFTSPTCAKIPPMMVTDSLPTETTVSNQGKRRIMPNEATYPTPGVIFVHSKLDEMGLSPAQFRVFCHIARRGECFACLESIANVCRLHPDTVAACLKFLVASGMVARTTRPGLSSVYTICPMSNWAPPRNEGAPETKGYRSPETKGYPPPRNEGVRRISL
jgi:hypothetical protein